MVTTTPTRMYSTTEVCRLAGITFRQADYWVRAGYLSPDHPTPGSGYDRRWPEREVVKACALSDMLVDGITFRKARALVAAGKVAELVERPLPEALP